jgi:hypothetical protein
MGELTGRFRLAFHTKERDSSLHPYHIPSNAPTGEYHFQYNLCLRQFDELHHPLKSRLGILDDRI